MNAPLKLALPFLLAASTAVWAVDSHSDTAAMNSTQIVCDGTIGNGSGGPNGRRFYYWIDTKGNAVDRIDIGCDYNQLSLFTSVELPNGWGFSIVNAGAHFIHDLKFTVHGRVTGANNDRCQYKLRFTGPAITGQFGIGFDHLGEPHDVHWKASDGAQTDWTKRVGQGKGPIHSPGFQDSPVGAPGEASAARHHHDFD